MEISVKPINSYTILPSTLHTSIGPTRNSSLGADIVLSFP